MDEVRDEGVADAEGGGGELVGDPGVKVRPVVIAEAGVKRPKPVEVHEGWAKEDGEELVVRDVLPLSVHDASENRRKVLYFT